MKFFALTAAALLAVASAASCSTTKLAPVVTGANGSQCSKDSGVSFLPPSVPKPEQIPKLCGSSACRAFLDELKKAQPDECTVDISNPPLQLYGELINPIEKACTATTAPTVAPTVAPTTALTSTPTTDPPTGNQTTPAPAPANNSC